MVGRGGVGGAEGVGGGGGGIRVSCKGGRAGRGFVLVVTKTP